MMSTDNDGDKKARGDGEEEVSNEPKPTNKVVSDEPSPTKVGDVCDKCARIGVVAHFIGYGLGNKHCDYCGIFSADSSGPRPMVYRYKEGMTDEEWKAVDDEQAEEKQRVEEERFGFDD